MKFSRKKLMSVAIVSALGVAGSAHAVNLSSQGRGQAVLFPYYSVNNSLSTLVTVTNTRAYPKVVKVRFREARNSQDVLDFNLYLSANDVWTGEVKTASYTDTDPLTLATSTVTGPVLVTADTSCTVPAINPIHDSGTLTTVTNTDGTTEKALPFRNYAYAYDNSTGAWLANNWDKGGSGLDRAYDGYIEVIEMGEIATSGGVQYTLATTAADTLDVAITHVPATKIPKDCKGVISEWDLTTASPGTHFDVGSGGLWARGAGVSGTAVLLSTATGAMYTTDATALDALYPGIDRITPTFGLGIHSSPGSISPNLNDANPVATLFAPNLAAGAATFVFDNTVAPWVAADDGLDGARAVSAVLARNAVMNEYVVDSTIGGTSEWVITMPTKHHFVSTCDNNPVPGTLPENQPFSNCFPDNIVQAGTSAERITVSAYGREEDVSGGSAVITQPSPPRPGNTPTLSLLYEANVISFANAGYTNSILGASAGKVQQNFNVPATAGWVRIGFDAATQVMQDDGTALASGIANFRGLPVIGFAAQRFTWADQPMADGKTMYNGYGGTFAHKYTQLVVDAGVATGSPTLITAADVIIGDIDFSPLYMP